LRKGKSLYDAMSTPVQRMLHPPEEENLEEKARGLSYAILLDQVPLSLGQ